MTDPELVKALLCEADQMDSSGKTMCGIFDGKDCKGCPLWHNDPEDLPDTENALPYLLRLAAARIGKLSTES